MHARTRMLRTLSAVAATILLSASTLFGMAPASASHPTPDIVLPAGEACEDFALGIDFLRGFPETRQFYDREGNLVREISAGRGTTIRYSNETTHETVTVNTPGSVSRTEYNPDRSRTVYATGFNGLILFSTDVGGPSATHYIGRLVYTISPEGVFEIVSFKGRQRDICAELS